LIQLQVLNTVLKNNDMSLITMNSLDRSFFSDYQAEFDYITDFYLDYGKAPDQLTFVNKFPNFDIIEVNETRKYLLDALYNDRNMRTMAITFNKVKDLIRDGQIDKAMKLYMQSTEELASSTHMDSIDILKDTSRYDDYIEKSNDYSKYYVGTGFKELDDLLGGWDRLEDLVTIVARPNQGKSWILLKCAIAAAEQGLRVGLYSGEMTERKVGYRFDTLQGHFSSTKLSKGSRDIQNEYKTYLDNLKSSVKGELHVLTPAMINGTAGVSALRAFIEKDKLDILFVDQHSLLEDDRGAKDPVTAAANISKDLKKLQVMKRIPIIAASQANRKSVDKDDAGSKKIDMGLENLAQTDRIGQDSTVVIGLVKKEDLMTLHILKSRDSGFVGHKLQYKTQLDRGIFVYIPGEVDVEADESLYEEIAGRYEADYTGGLEDF
jgi:replicative DNA helicase